MSLSPVRSEFLGGFPVMDCHAEFLETTCGLPDTTAMEGSMYNGKLLMGPASKSHS